jgi:hypothetical protein
MIYKHQNWKSRFRDSFFYNENLLTTLFHHQILNHSRMKKHVLNTLIVLFVTISSFLNAQKVSEVTKDVKEIDSKDRKEGWTRIGGIGADFSWLNLINPRSGAGDNRVGFGGLLNYSANLTRGKFLWDNKFGVQIAAVKVAEQDWVKANDVLQATSQFGYAVKKNWYVAGIADFQSQFLSTYGPNFLKANPKGVTGVQRLSGKFLAPAIFRFGPGVIHTPNAKTKILFSPVAIKAVIVTDTAINRLVDRNGTFFPLKPGENKTVDFQFGAQLRLDYANKFFGDKLIYATTLDLYSNYLRNPQNIDMEWYHSLDLVVAKGISLNFKSDWFYDDDILVLRSSENNRKGKAVFFRNAMLLKYTGVF